MARLQEAFLLRAEDFAHRVLDVAEALETSRCPRRLVEQIAACGTSVGANMYEASEAMSRKDFTKSMGIALKELSETRFWLRIIARRTWLEGTRLHGLQTEADELWRILGTIIARSRAVI